MKYTLDWLTDPEVFAVNKIAAHSDHRIYACLLYTTDAADE